MNINPHSRNWRSAPRRRPSGLRPSHHRFARATGYANGSQSFNLSIGGNVNAGGFTGTWNAQQIIFWCIRLNEFFNFGNNYTDYTPAVVNNQTMTMLGQLFHEGFATALASRRTPRRSSSQSGKSCTTRPA
jgi:hypothetical protein